MEMTGLEYFRFTPFNNITLLMMALTAATATARWRGRPRSNWPLLYYALVSAYTFGFDGSYSRIWLAFGALCGASIRFGAAPARWAECLFFIYVLWRSVGLLLMW
jgi:hypothetical protein